MNFRYKNPISGGRPQDYDDGPGLWGHMRKREGGKERVPTVEPSASGESARR